MNIRFRRSLFALLALTPAVLPQTTRANEAEALEQCVQTFIKEVVPAERAVEIRHESIRASTTALPSNRKRVNVIARGEAHGKLFGRATCLLGRNGTLETVYVYGARESVATPSRPKAVIRNG